MSGECVIIMNVYFQWSSIAILVNEFLIENGKMVNSMNSQNNYFIKNKMVLDQLFKLKHFSCSKFSQIPKFAKTNKFKCLNV